MGGWVDGWVGEWMHLCRGTRVSVWELKREVRIVGESLGGAQSSIAPARLGRAHNFDDGHPGRARVHVGKGAAMDPDDASE